MTSPLANLQKAREVVYITPEPILDCARAYWGGPIPCDPATEPDNPTRAMKFYTKEDNGIGKDWGRAAWVNPPFGEFLREWLKEMRRQHEAGCELIALLPCGTRTSTKYWQRDALHPGLTAICWIDHRVPFLRPSDDTGLFPGIRNYEPLHGNNSDSVIHFYGIDSERFADHFCKLGKIFIGRTV